MTEMKIDPADIKRYRELLDLQEQISSELDGIKAKWRRHGSGKFGAVRINQPQRFSVEKGVEWMEENMPGLLPLVKEEVVSAKKMKELLPPKIYDSLSSPYGELRVTIAKE